MGRFRVSGRAMLVVALTAVMVGVAAAPAAAAPFTSPDGLWTWTRPLPHGYPAQAISAPAPGVLFVATTEADLLVTRDGGADWAWSRTGGVAGLTALQGVQFVSASEGWAWGAVTPTISGAVLHTTDGGATWQPSLPLPDMAPLYVDFVSPSTGWVVAGDNLNNVLGTFVFFTSDGGQTWSAPVALPGDDAFPNEESDTFATLAPQGGGSAVLMENIWDISGDVVASLVWRTADGGATWSAPKVLSDAYMLDAAFSTATVGWAVDYSFGQNWLWRTTDGGASWRKVLRTAGLADVATVGTDVWVIGRGTLRSTDTGATWHSIPGASGSRLAFSTPADGWITGGAVYKHTGDGGKTWRRVTSAPQPGVTSLASAGGDTVWAAAHRVIRSTDGGRHWRSCTKRVVNAVSAVSANQAWAVGANGLVIHSSDAGRHWKRQASGVGVGLKGVFFVDARHGWARGAKSTLLRTTNGGRSWTHVHANVSHELSQVVFADARHGIAMGDASRVFLLTSDGGRTWSHKRLPAGQWPTVASMPDASHILIIALHEPHAYSFVSSDGGKTWQRTGDLPRGHYVSIARSGSLLCAVDGGVATSRDGGATWVDGGAPTGGDLAAVQFVGAHGLIIGGAQGVMTRDLATAPLP